MKKRFLSAVLSVALVLGGVALPGGHADAAIPFTDVNNHWVKPYIVKAINYGLISGYDDGTFKPNNPVTRAEFCTMVSSGFKTKLQNPIYFTDVKEDAWYYEPISKGISSGYISGYEDDTFRPNNYISRQEAAVIANRLIPNTDSSASIYHYSDRTQIKDWAYDAVQRVISKGYMGAYDDGKLHPDDALTRAQAVKVLCDILDKERVIWGETIINSRSGSASRTIYTGDVLVDKAVADGSVTFENCVFLGALNIKGGGSKSIHLKNCRVGYCTVNRTDNAVRVVAEGSTSVRITEVSNRAILEEGSIPYATFRPGFYVVKVNEGAYATLDKGFYEKVYMQGAVGGLGLEPKAEIEVLEVTKNGNGSMINMQEGSKITAAYGCAPFSFCGEGKVSQLYANSEGITYETKPANITNNTGNKNAVTSSENRLVIVANPANGATNVSLSQTVSLTFNKQITAYNGSALNATNLNEIINFYAKKVGGSTVPFKASINKDGNTITITPTDTLKKKSKYFITFDECEFIAKGDKKIYNAKFSTEFTCGDGTVDGVSWKPADETRGVAASVKPAINFANTIAAADGTSEINAAFLRKNLVFRQLDFSDLDDKTTEEDINYATNGKSVSFTAEVNKKLKGITVTPKAPLTEGKTYYLAFPGNTFKYADSTGSAIDAQYVTFTVGYVLPTVSFTPKDGKTFFSNSGDISIQFSDVMYNASNEELTTEYVKNNITIHDNTGGGDIAFTADIDETIKGTKLTLDPVSLLPDGHEYTVTVPTGKFLNSDKKSNETSTTSFTSAYTTPVINSISATGTTTVIKTTVTANMNGTAYLRLAAPGTTYTKIDQIKSGGSSFATKEGEPVSISVTGAFTGGETYTAYVYMTSSSKTSAIVSTPVKIIKDVAAVSTFRLTPTGGPTTTVSTVADKNAYSVTLPYGTTAFDLDMTTASDNTIQYDLAGGSSYTTATVSSSGNATVNVPLTDTTVNKVITVLTTGTPKTDTRYTLTIRVAGNTGVYDLSVAEKVGTLNSGNTFIMAANATSATVTITADDPSAVISCPVMTPATATGSLTGTIALTGTSQTVTYTIKSNQDTKDYTFSFQKLE